MSKAKSLGQHFLVSESIAKSIVDCAKITKKDTVLEIGTGRGALVPFLCKSANKVISIEKDKTLYLQALEKFSNFSNLTLKHGDGFKTDLDFTIFVSNLPYSESRKAVEWLLEKKFLRAIIMVQKEFAQKLLLKPDKSNRAITVLASYGAKIDLLFDVPKSHFSPKPKVDSVVLQLTKTNQVSKNIIRTVNKLFSYRKKTVHNVAKQFGIAIDSNQRFEDLTVGEIINLAKQISH